MFYTNIHTYVQTQTYKMSIYLLYSLERKDRDVNHDNGRKD